MENHLELQQMIYNLLEQQIKFGSYCMGDSLPTIKEACGYFHVSFDTVRHVYLRLKQNGYISLSTCTGAVVQVQYSNEDMEQHIRSYFSCRRSMLLDLARSSQSLFTYAEWSALKNSPPHILDEIQRTCLADNVPSLYRTSHNLFLIYGALGNDLFTRLIWQVFIVYYAPFLSIPQNIKYFRDIPTPVTGMIALCRQKDWKGLLKAVNAQQRQIYVILRQFYENDMPAESSAQQMEFSWNIYKKASQVCYGLSMKILQGVRGGVYPIGSLLPSPSAMAKEQQISVNTVRRSLALLNKLGAVQSINGVGTKVLLPDSVLPGRNLADTAIRKRLLDFIKSIQILAFSCRLAVRSTIDAMDASCAGQWVEQLDETRRLGRYEISLYVCIEYISQFSPCQAVRVVYAELLRQLFWGYPLRDLHGNKLEVNAFYLPYLEYFKECLHRLDGGSFSEKLEELLIIEVEFTRKLLTDMGLQEAASVTVPVPAKDFPSG